MRLPIRLFVILYALSLAVVAWGESGSVSKTSGTKNSTSVTIAKPGASSGASASKTKSQPPEAKQGKQAARKPVGKPASQKASPAPAKGQPAAKQAQKPAPKPEVQKPPTQPVKVSVTESVTPAVAPPTPPTPTEARISMSFDKADVNSVIKFLSVAGGVPIVQDPELKGSVTIVSLKDIPLSDAYEVVNAALRVRGYTMVGTLQDKVIRVVSLKKAIADRSGVQSGKEPSAMPSGDNFITQVIPLDYVSASKLKDEMKPLVADDQASIVAITATNTLIVTDIAGNVRRIQQIVKELDKKDIFDIVDVNIYPCKHSSADALVETLNKIFQISKPQAQPQQGRSQDGQPQPAVKSDEGLVTLKGEIRIASDVRTNSLIISAAKPKLELVMKVIEELDIETQAEVKSRVFALNNADAKLVAEQLNKIFEQPQGGMDGAARRYSYYDYYYGSSSPAQTTTYAGLKRNVIVADVRTNSVIVTATDQNMKAFEDMITKLDVPTALNEIMEVFPLQYAKAADLADTLNRLFRGEYRRPGSFFEMFMYGARPTTEESGPLAELKNITVVAEEKTNKLLVTGPPQSFKTLKNLIEGLDKRTPQVFIEVAIVDVTLDNSTKFGVEWNWTNTGAQIQQTAGTDLGLSSETTGLKYSIIGNNWSALLHMLSLRSDVKVLSTQAINTADNVEAHITIGVDEPYVSSEEDTTGGNFRRSVDFKNVAVALTVTPHVLRAPPDSTQPDMISMEVLQTINEIIGREVELNAPRVAKREAKTSILTPDGKTVVIGGIIKHNKEKNIKGVPILSQIPLIGELFKARESRTQSSELMVFITPHVINNELTASKITEETREKLSVKPPETLVKPEEGKGG